MRAIIQRVSEASVTVENKKISEIGKGCMILLGIEDADTEDDIKWLSSKISKLRIFNDEEGIMNCSVKDAEGELLIISQFTLHASVKKGNRPSYIKASKPDFAVPMYEKFIKQMKDDTGLNIKAGQFGAMMQVHLINDGPVTIFIDTKDIQ